MIYLVPGRSSVRPSSRLVERNLINYPLSSQVDITDPGNSTRGTIIVQRIGVNRPPRFPDCSAYEPSIPESSPLGTSVITV